METAPGSRWIYQAIVVALGLLGIAWLLASGRRLPVWLHVAAALAMALAAAFLWFIASRGMTLRGPEYALLLVFPAAVYLFYGYAQMTGAIGKKPGASTHASTASSPTEAPREISRTAPGEPLTAEEESRASRIAVYCLNAHGTDPHGWPDAYLGTVGHGLTRQEVFREMERRPLEPGWDEFNASGPVSLLEQYRYGTIVAREARILLQRVAEGELHETMAPPLTDDERTQAAAMQVYYVYYEDRFHHGGGSDSFAVAICRTREDAEEELKRRGREAQAGGDGYSVIGPTALVNDHRADVVREALRALGGNERKVVPIPSHLW